MSAPSSSTPAEPAEIARKVIWMLFLRVVIVTILLGVTIILNLKEAAFWDDPVQRFLILVVIATYAVTIPLALLARRPAWARRLAVPTVAVDLALAAALVHATSGGDSAFTFLFSLAIINAAIIDQRRGAGIAASAASGIFVLEVLLTRFQLLPTFGDTEPTQSAATIAVTLLVNVAAFFLVAYLAAYLAEAKREADQTAQSHLEDLTRLEELHGYVVASVESGLITMDADGRVTLVNPASETILGRPPTDLIGRRLIEVFPELSRLLDPDRQSFGPDGRRRQEHTIQLPDGRERQLEFVLAPLRKADETRPDLLLSLRDLTDLRAMEAAVRRNERLAAVGELAAAMAHEIRNPLASMGGSIQLLQSELDLSGDQGRLMAIVLREADRLEALIRDFLAYARPAPPAIQQVNLGRLVEETADLFRHDPRHSEQLDLRVEAAAGLIAEVDPRQITQVLLNLLANGTEAMAGNGRLSLTVQRGAAEYAALCVTDEGPGLAGAETTRVFDPFYTTKEQGTGLGLSVVHRIVDAHRGRIYLDSAPGQGCRVRVELPLSQPAAVEAAS